MDEMLLHMDSLDFDSGRASEGFSVGGIIYVTIGDLCFPEARWYDMVYADLKSWLPRLISFAYNHTNTCVFEFMDGPYQLKLFRHTDNIITVTCLEGKKLLIAQTEIDFQTFLKSTAQCVRMYDRTLYENKKHMLFANELKDLRSILKQHSKDLGEYHV